MLSVPPLPAACHRRLQATGLRDPSRDAGDDELAIGAAVVIKQQFTLHASRQRVLEVHAEAERMGCGWWQSPSLHRQTTGVMALRGCRVVMDIAKAGV